MTRRSALRLSSMRRAVLWASLLGVVAHSSQVLAQSAAPSAAPGASASAAATASQVELVVVQASNSEGTSSPELSDLPLTRAPFSAYRLFTLVSRSRLALNAAGASAPLPNGDSVSVALAGRTPAGRYQISVQLRIGGRTHNLQFAANPGDPFFTARATGTDAALILGFVLR